MGDSKTSYHPALTVNNIKTSISVVLTLENSQYSTWVELFKIHARSHRVLHHIIPPLTTDKVTEKHPLTDEEQEWWSTLDAAVISWIYSTISGDLLETIIEPDATAMAAWNRLRDIFQDNQNSRAVTLEQDFSSTKMEDFPNASAYCQRLKGLSDQLRNVGAPVDNNRLVLQLVSGLTEPYNGVATLIRQSSPLPQFYQARSMITLEEASLTKRAAMTSNSVSGLVATFRDDDSGSDSWGNTRAKNKNHKKNSEKKMQNRGSGRGPAAANGQNSGARGGAGRGGGLQKQRGVAPLWQQQAYPPWGWPWATPPCPFPTQGWARSQGPTRAQQGVLGPRPQQQAYAASQSPSYVPTDLESAFHTMSLQQPDPSWYMDTGATSHMTSTNGLSDGDAHNEM
ncbi:uncharacterized protein LOC130826537 [Amaranthus tricolor]|uniref:uncharacterized protein LOC130826537 n=1 Tax=Amaranthus tricolor TaxID=29722 RepID=UPI00258EDDBE|nr:uncharacterized protein LOC130826537 [Amaranthus tricolor]